MTPVGFPMERPSNVVFAVEEADVDPVAKI